MSLICKKATSRLFSTTICVAGRERLSWYFLPRSARRGWQRNLVPRSALHLQHRPEMEPDSDEQRRTELLTTLENFRWLGSKTPCFPVNGNKVRIQTRFLFVYFCNSGICVHRFTFCLTQKISTKHLLKRLVKQVKESLLLPYTLEQESMKMNWLKQLKVL